MILLVGEYCGCQYSTQIHGFNLILSIVIDWSLLSVRMRGFIANKKYLTSILLPWTIFVNRFQRVIYWKNGCHRRWVYRSLQQKNFHDGELLITQFNIVVSQCPSNKNVDFAFQMSGLHHYFVSAAEKNIRFQTLIRMEIQQNSINLISTVLSVKATWNLFLLKSIWWL